MPGGLGDGSGLSCCSVVCRRAVVTVHCSRDAFRKVPNDDLELIDIVDFGHMACSAGHGARKVMGWRTI